MALVSISPFCFEQFGKIHGNFTNWIINYVENSPIHGRCGWSNHLQAYDYSRPGKERGAQPVWQKGVKTRTNFNKCLGASLSCPDYVLVDVVNKIMEWGGMIRYDIDAAPKIRQALKALEAEKTVSTWDKRRVNDITVTKRVASRTKIFEMYDPTRWVIYDSRVATALACLRDQSLKSDPASTSREICWPIPQGRPNECRKLDGYPGAHTAYQASLGFLYGSWLCRIIAQRLRSQQSAQSEQGKIPLGGWRTFHIEMVLWTLGVSRF